MPPIRIVMAADDKEFSHFLQGFVKEHVAKLMSQSRAVDFRVFLIPNQINTLAHYLAMYDDMYCQQVYLQFQQNPIISVLRKNLSIEEYMRRIYMQCDPSGEKRATTAAVDKDDEWGRTLRSIDDGVQDYIRDAVRIFPLKVFSCEFFKETADDRPYKSVFFTSRFELGHYSVYEKLTAVNDILRASNPERLLEAQRVFE